MSRMQRWSTLFLLFVARGAFAQSDSVGPELSILADRFFLRFPGDAMNQARPVDIMSAPPGEEEETRIVLDHGDERLVFFAQELETLGTPDLATDWKKVIDGQGAGAFNVAYMRHEETNEVVRYEPDTISGSGQAVMIGGILVRCADSLLMNAQIYINPKAYERLASYQQLADSIFTSFRPGSRVLDLSSRTARFDDLSIDLPKDHILTTDGAYDFKVYRIKRALQLGETKQASITVYFGDHPSLFSREMEGSVPPEQVPGTIFGRSMDWIKVNDPVHGNFLMEQIVHLSDEDAGNVAHVAVVGNDEAEVAALVELAQRMRLEPK